MWLNPTLIFCVRSRFLRSAIFSLQLKTDVLFLVLVIVKNISFRWFSLCVKRINYNKMEKKNKKCLRSNVQNPAKASFWPKTQKIQSRFYSTIKKRIQVSHDHRSFKRNLSNCEQKPEKVKTSTGFEPVTSRYRCDALTNWAMKPLTLGAGHLWVLMCPWRMDVKWYMKCFIYWTADMKSSELWSS